MTRTALYRRTERQIRAWCKSRKMRLVSPLAHIHPRAYVIARIAESCIIVSVPACDMAPVLRNVQHQRCRWIREFEPSLQQGDWCSTAYVCEAGNQREVAIKVVP